MDTKMKKKIYLVRDNWNDAGIKWEKTRLIELSGREFVNGKPHTWSKKSAALAGGEC